MFQDAVLTRFSHSQLLLLLLLLRSGSQSLMSMCLVSSDLVSG